MRVRNLKAPAPFALPMTLWGSAHRILRPRIMQQSKGTGRALLIPPVDFPLAWRVLAKEVLQLLLLVGLKGGGDAPCCLKYGPGV